MSYHRGEPYVWNDGADMHIWSNIREGETGYNSAVRVDLKIFDEVVVRRFCAMVRDGRLPPWIVEAARKMGGKFEAEMLKAVRGTREPQ